MICSSHRLCCYGYRRDEYESIGMCVGRCMDEAETETVAVTSDSLGKDHDHSDKSKEGFGLSSVGLCSKGP